MPPLGSHKDAADELIASIRHLNKREEEILRVYLELVYLLGQRAGYEEAQEKPAKATT